MVDVQVRAERAADPAELERVREVLLQAFGRDDEADLLEALRADPAWLPQLALVAVVGDRHGADLVGHIAGTRLDVGGSPGVALAPLAVAPERQGCGIGGRLVEEQLARARAAGERLVVVVGEPAYYSRFGFRPASVLGLDGPYSAAGDAFQALALDGGHVPRGWVTYPAAFGG